MLRELIILVKSEEFPVQRERYNPFYGHYCTGNEIARTARGVSPDEMTAVTRIQEFAKYHNVVFKVLRVSDLRVRLKFRLGKEEKTPLIVCGKKILRGVPSMSDLSELIS